MKVTDYKFEDIGIAHEQYFRGRGVCLTDYDRVHIGIGDTPCDAYCDAIEQALSMVDQGEETISIPDDIAEHPDYETPIWKLDCDIDHPDECDLYPVHYYVALYIKGES